jgi:hypothetical protein
MTEKELVDTFIEIESLDIQYKFSCANATDFAHLLYTGVRIEAALEQVIAETEIRRKTIQ